MSKNREFEIGSIRITFVQNQPMTVAVATWKDNHKVIGSSPSQCHPNDVWDPMKGITTSFGKLKTVLARFRQDMWFSYPELLSIPPTQVIEEAFFDAFKKDLKG